MKTIGLLGGMSFESTLNALRDIHAGVRARLGGQHSPRILMESVDFADLNSCLAAGDWDGVADLLCPAAARIAGAGADFLLVCSNTVHNVYDAVAAAVSIPVVHIADAAARGVAAAGLSRVGLLGTRATMEMDFYSGWLARKHGISVLIPEAEDRGMIDRVIFEELCQGRITAASRREYERVVGELAGRGAQGVILGCTEIAMLLPPAESELPLFDTAALHAAMAVDMALCGDG
ncbi:aspartate/glutamate racemase family protein [Desulfolutivibrio sp.]|uniref:aspartate/glutamate racemase family protein n=1 Tax=Desulfolutivibrio sp. TaxID=2773296 RepID=UPI002F96631E